MKFLDDIEELKRLTQELLDAASALERKITEGEERAAEAARRIEEAIANAPKPRTFPVKLPNGQEFEISERDALLFVAGFCTNLDQMTEVEFPLENGQTIKLNLTDMEQASVIMLEAAKAAPST